MKIARRSKLLLAGVVLPLSLACPAAQPPRPSPTTGPTECGPTETCAGRPCLQVGTLNAFCLGANRRWDRPLRTPEEVRGMAAFLADDLDLEVVVMQEINAAITGTEEEGIIYSREPYRWLSAALGERGYRLMHGASGHAQRVVIAYDADEVELLKSARELPARDHFDFGEDCRRAVKRPLAARLRAGSFDFWLVGLQPQVQTRRRVLGLDPPRAGRRPDGGDRSPGRRRPRERRDPGRRLQRRTITHRPRSCAHPAVSGR